MTITAIDPPVVKTLHLLSALGISAGTLIKYLSLGQIPPPDLRGNGNLKLWKLSTLRAWRPDIADACAAAVARKPIPLHRPSDSLPTAA